MRRAAIVAVVVGAVLTVAPSSEARSAARTFTFYGSGWGHGLGMSQYGAYGLARKGWSHQQILRHYYHGTTVGPARQSPATLRIGLDLEARRLHVKAAHGTVRLRIGNAVTGAVLGGPIPVGATWSITPVGSTSFRVRDASGKVVATHAGTRLYVSYASTGGRAFVREAGHTYGRGYLEIDVYAGDGCWPGACLRVVAVLSPQSYLDGLGEVPSSWPMQALMAQADAARTYAFEKVARLGQHRVQCNCGLYASTWDQAYIGWDKEVGPLAARWVRAVARTNREVVLDHGQPIQAYYTSSSGGYTENNENVWGGAPLPYLRGTCDPGDFTSANPNRAWRVGPLSAFAVSDHLLPFTGAIGTVTRFIDVRRGVSGRIRSLVVVGTKGRATISGSTLMSAFGLHDDRVWINVDKNVTGHIRGKYDALECAPGLPAGPQVAVPGGRAQAFENGTIYWNRAHGRAYWVHGSALAFYRSAGGPAGYLGLPTTDVRRGRRARAVTRFSRGHVVVCSSKGRCIDHAPRGHRATDLAVSTAWGGSAVVGAPVTVTVTVRNEGPVAATARLTVRLPAGTFASAAASRGRCVMAGGLVCSFGPLAAMARASVAIRLVPTVSGTLRVRMSVVGDAPDLATANNRAASAVAARAPTTLTKVQARPKHRAPAASASGGFHAL